MIRLPVSKSESLKFEQDFVRQVSTKNSKGMFGVVREDSRVVRGDTVRLRARCIGRVTVEDDMNKEEASQLRQINNIKVEVVRE